MSTPNHTGWGRTRPAGWRPDTPADRPSTSSHTNTQSDESSDPRSSSQSNSASSSSSNLTLSVERMYGSFPLKAFEEMTAHWFCAREECDRTLTKDGEKKNPSMVPSEDEKTGFRLRPTNKDNPDVFVLNCGHFLCKECKEEMQRNDKIRAKFVCKGSLGRFRCQMGIESTDLPNLPVADHILVLRHELQMRGLRCRDCSAYPYRKCHRYPRHLMFVCIDSSCSQMEKIDGLTAYNLGAYPEEVKAPDGSMIKLCRLCLFCASSEKGGHRNHECVQIAKVSRLLKTMRDGNDEELANVELRTPFHISMVSPNSMAKLLKETFGCPSCNVEYGTHSVPSPCLLDCSHLVCTECQAKANANGRCPICDDRSIGGNQHVRRVADLQFMTSRDKDDYKKCNSCHLLHPKPFMRKKNTTCVFCIVSPSLMTE